MKYPMIVRKDKLGMLIAFFPGEPANYGYIQYYARGACHGEASMDYYWGTKKASKEEAEDFRAWYQRYSDSLPGEKEEFYIMHRLTHKLMQKAWERR